MSEVLETPAVVETPAAPAVAAPATPAAPAASTPVVAAPAAPAVEDKPVTDQRLLDWYKMRREQVGREARRIGAQRHRRRFPDPIPF